MYQQITCSSWRRDQCPAEQAPSRSVSKLSSHVPAAGLIEWRQQDANDGAGESRSQRPHLCFCSFLWFVLTLCPASSLPDPPVPPSHKIRFIVTNKIFTSKYEYVFFLYGGPVYVPFYILLRGSLQITVFSGPISCTFFTLWLGLRLVLRSGFVFFPSLCNVFGWCDLYSSASFSPENMVLALTCTHSQNRTHSGGCSA